MAEVRCFWLAYADPLRWFVKDDDDATWRKREHTREWLDAHEWRMASPVMVDRRGRRARSQDFGPGAMCDLASHSDHAEAYKGGDMIGPDGRCLVVQLPPHGHWWYVDGKAASGGHWSRTGDPAADPPTVSVTPSILTPDYHGFLTDGVLREV